MLQQAIEERSPKSDIENDIITESEGKNSRRKKPAPEETRKVYKLMRLFPDGKLQTLFIGRETYELGKWYDADAPGMDVLEKQKQDYFYLFDENNNIVDSRPIKYGKKNRISGLSKKDIETANENNQRWVAVGRYANGGRKYANMGINGSEGVTDYAMRPGIHAGSLPVMTQIGSGSTRDIRDNNLVWVEGEVAYGNGAPEEAAANGGEITTHIPVDGGYEKGTSSFVTKGMNWYISGAFLPKRIMGDVEAREIIDKFNQENGGNVPHDFMRRDGKVFNAETMQLEDAPEGWKESYNDGKGKNSRKDFSIAFSRYIPKTKEEKISTIKQLIEIAKTVKGRVVRRIVDIVTDRQIQDLKKKGLDIDPSYVHSIENSSINHSESRHGGKSTPRGNYVALTESDYELIPDILNDYDSIDVSSNKNKVGNTVIEYEKELPDGTIMYLEEVRTGRKSLALQTIYKIKKGTDSSDGLLHSATTTTPKTPSDNFNSDSKDTTKSSTMQEKGKNSRKGADLYRDKEEYKEGQVLDIKGNLDGYTVEGMTMPYNHPETLLEAWRNKHPNYYAFLSDDGRGIEVYPVEGGKTRLEALYSKARTSKQRQQYAERKARQMRDRAESTAKPLGVKVNIIEPGTETDADRLKSKGWYDTKTGEILSRIVPSADLRLV